ncbi:MAG TPA: magnesium transporter [Isosphaeraceae bacterium]|nr:magnesium transporter [Isosphaeraceae bacterium]
MRHPLLVPDLRELLHDGEVAGLRDFFSGYHPGRVAELIEDLETQDGDALFRILPARDRAQVLSYLDNARQVRLFGVMPATEAAELLHVMSHDERADLVNRLDEDVVDPVLPHLAQAEREDIRRLASYQPGTAGAVMTTDYVTLPPHITVREALDRLRHEAPDRETIYYCYVVDHQRRLIGFVSLKRLILSRRSAVIESIMQRDVIFARVDEDQESVARQIDKYDLIAIPVVDASDMLVGIITHDDAMDILRQEQTEDILAFGGVSRDVEANEETYWQGRIVEAVRRRIGWLLLLFVGGTITRYIIHRFDWVDTRFPEIEFDTFIPLLIGTGGNAGSQAVGTIIRGLALGEIQRSDTSRVLFREVLTGLLLGALLGVLGFVFAWLLLGHTKTFATVIALAIIGICVWANGVGALVPLLARRFGIDPAVVSAPLISTLVDATGLVIFYTVAILILIKLAGSGP